MKRNASKLESETARNERRGGRKDKQLEYMFTICLNIKYYYVK